MFGERSGRSGVAWESRGCGLGVEGRRSGLLRRYPIDVGPSSWGGRCFVPGDGAPNIVGWGGIVACGHSIEGGGMRTQLCCAGVHVGEGVS